MECWVSKQGKNGCVEFFYEGYFWKIFKYEDFGFKLFEKRSNFEDLFRRATKKIKT